MKKFKWLIPLEQVTNAFNKNGYTIEYDVAEDIFVATKKDDYPEPETHMSMTLKGLTEGLFAAENLKINN